MRKTSLTRNEMVLILQTYFEKVEAQNQSESERLFSPLGLNTKPDPLLLVLYKHHFTLALSSFLVECLLSNTTNIHFDADVICKTIVLSLNQVFPKEAQLTKDNGLDELCTKIKGHVRDAEEHLIKGLSEIGRNLYGFFWAFLEAVEQLSVKNKLTPLEFVGSKNAYDEIMRLLFSRDEFMKYYLRMDEIELPNLRKKIGKEKILQVKEINRNFIEGEIKRIYGE
jgi:hypothetical protein